MAYYKHLNNSSTTISVFGEKKTNEKKNCYFIASICKIFCLYTSFAMTNPLMRTKQSSLKAQNKLKWLLTFTDSKLELQCPFLVKYCHPPIYSCKFILLKTLFQHWPVQNYTRIRITIIRTCKINACVCIMGGDQSWWWISLSLLWPVHQCPVCQKNP